MQIRVANLMPTRHCDVCLALQDDCVFADFKLDGSQLYLVRISFDGYGCCYPSWESTPVKMTEGESARIVEYVRASNTNRSEAYSEVLHSLSLYFLRCERAVWADALREYNLV